EHGESLAVRLLEPEAPRRGLAELGLDAEDEAALRRVIRAGDGLVLVTGPTGSGKTTTLYSTLKYLAAPDVNIVTVEDPIEFIHQDALSSVSQREVGIDTPGFAHALRAALRQDPDVILVGEIRDEETMDIGLKAAETGHLVLSTLHTPDVARTIGRVLALSGQSVQETRERFADNLKAIVAQRLIPAAEGGLCLAAEVLVVTGTARESLRKPEGNPSLKDIMERGSHPYMMQTFEMHLRELVKQGRVTVEDAKNAMT
ncbi:MAG: type IV pilus twitching motility protein PilT, partial [Deltaproteobacteria bacterium]